MSAAPWAVRGAAVTGYGRFIANFLEIVIVKRLENRPIFDELSCVEYWGLLFWPTLYKIPKQIF